MKMALQGLCIKVIVDEFDRYYLAFSTSDDPNLKRKFEFLQRVYSYEIASQLCDAGKLQTNYIDLLVNKYLKILDTDWFRDCPWKTVTEKFAEVGPNLQKMYITQYNRRRPWHQVIHHLRNLEVLFFPGHCNDEILKCISQFCPNVVEIDVPSSSGVSDKGIQYLCRKENGEPVCPKLRKLLIRGCHVMEEGIMYLIQNLRSLEDTDYTDLPKLLYLLHKNNLSALNTVEPYKLACLDLEHLNCVRYYNDILKVCLTLCPFLKSLSCHVSDKEHVDLFSNLLELENLYLAPCYSTTKLDVSDILKPSGKKLKSLTVCDLTLSVSSLSKSCPCLKELHLDRVFFQNDDGTTPLFKCLETCDFKYNTLDMTTVKSISLLLKYSPKLENIIFDRSDLSSSELKAEILRCGYLPVKSVDFYGSIVDMNFIKDILLNFHSLKWMNLELCELTSMEKLQLYNLAKLLPNNPEMSMRSSIFDNYDYHFSDDDSDALFEFGA